METRNTNYESAKSDIASTKTVEETKQSVIDALDPEKISSDLMATFFWTESKEFKRFQEINKETAKETDNLSESMEVNKTEHKLSIAFNSLLKRNDIEEKILWLNNKPKNNLSYAWVMKDYEDYEARVA